MYRGEGSIADFEDTTSFDDELDQDGLPTVDMDAVEITGQKRHFLDYAAVPPPDFEEHFSKTLSIASESEINTHKISGEQYKIDKKYEKDGEISDFELAASNGGYTKKEFTQDDNNLHLIGKRDDQHKISAKPKTHFLDENPIPPEYMLEREHRSLDRNFERLSEKRVETETDRATSESRSSRERTKAPSYSLTRFLDSGDSVQPNSLPSPCSSQQQRSMTRSNIWTDSFDSRYGTLQLPSSSSVAGEMDKLGPKVECVYSLLSMLGSNDSLEMSQKFLDLSRTPETCLTLRRSGCIPLLVQMIHSADGSGPNDNMVRKRAGMALHNVVHSHTDEKAGRREAKVLRLLDQIMEYCSFLRTLLQSGGEAIADDFDRHPLAAISSLMKVSFDQEHRQAMCELGALQAIPSLVHLDHAAHGHSPKPEDQNCNSLRRYALMTLTNLTFGDEVNKALLCQQKLFMEALVAQLDAAPDDLLQVTASVLRNLSWRADANMKAVLNEIGTVTALAHAAMKNKSENTLKAILSALWNLSAHCSTNKAEFCAVDGALAFLVDTLTYEGPSKTLKIIENAGGILRNVSSHIAIREHYRQILREHNCLAILLQQLKSESLTVVSNACGTLWNLSARCPEDQKFLWDNGAVPMLRSLIHSKHAMISEGSSAALKNLINFRPSIQNQDQLQDPIARSMGLKKLPTLNARKQKALQQELGEKQLAETCENIDLSPGSKDRSCGNNKFERRFPLVGAAVAGGAVAHTLSHASRLQRSNMLTKSESRDSVFSAKSDSAAYEQFFQNTRSHSASDANRKCNVDARSFPATFAIENEEEPTEEQPIDYSVKYNENLSNKIVDDAQVRPPKPIQHPADQASNYATYQETDLDQPTDFSLRYAENQLNEADVEATNKLKETNSKEHNGLIHVMDSVKCYQTEDTPYVISNAASITDLRQQSSSKLETAQDLSCKSMNINERSNIKGNPINNNPRSNFGNGAVNGSGTFTPEKPINYCEEGTPAGYFSRYDSLSSLDESPTSNSRIQKDAKDDTQNFTLTEDTNIITSTTPPILPKGTPPTQKKIITPSSNNKSTINSAQETPLMFSRHSSMDSLVEEDVGPLDDKSSVVSDFSRLASGVISPSEIPDSPTQSMPQSPRRLSNTNSNASPHITPSNVSARDIKRSQLQSVFEDNINRFNVENTPAQFSSATSLSNLSIIDDADEQTTHEVIYAETSDGTSSTVGKVRDSIAGVSEGKLLKVISIIVLKIYRALILQRF